MIGNKKCLKDEVSTITRSWRIMGNPEINVQSRAKVKSLTPKRLVSENEAMDFLKILKRSEYKIIEQLDRMPAQSFF